MTHQECREYFVEMLYEELDRPTRSSCEEHLRDCAACAAEYSSLRATLSTMDLRRYDDPPASFWAEHWTGIERTIGRAPVRVVPFAPSWAYAAAAIVLVAFGVYIGRTFFAGSASTAPGSPARGHEASVLTAAATREQDSVTAKAGAYLERSKVLLQGIVNEEGHSPASMARQQRVSRELVSEASVLTAALTSPEQRQVRELIADLQIILLQLANIEVRPGQPALELVRSGVDRKSILFKIHVEELRRLARVPARSDKDSLSSSSL